MKKAIIALALGVIAFAACKKEEKQDTIEIPTLINASFTSLTNKSVEAGTPNKLTVTASENGAELSIVFYNDKVYLSDGSYSVGTASGNYELHYKDQYVDNDAVSGALTVSSDVDNNYTISGAIKLNNTESTLVKLNATGKMEYELPAEYLYTKESKDGTIVYSIYSLPDESSHNTLLAMATIHGAGAGTYTVDNTNEPGTASIGNCATSGTFISIDKWGYFMQMSGSVTVAEKAGKLNFTFDGVYDGAYNNCQETSASSISIAPYTTDRAFAYGCKFKYFYAPSEILEGVYELTVKIYTPDLKEFYTTTVLVDKEDYFADKQGSGNAFMIAPFSYYVEAGVDKVALDNCTYLNLDGEVYPIADGYYNVINDATVSQGAMISIPIDASWVAPEPLNTLLNGDIYGFMSWAYPEE